VFCRLSGLQLQLYSQAVAASYKTGPRQQLESLSEGGFVVLWWGVLVVLANGGVGTGVVMG